MKEQFRKWMIGVENKKASTANSYVYAINRISSDYARNERNSIDIYKCFDTEILKTIRDLYSITGKYKDFGSIGNGTVRNAIATYVRFFEKQDVNIEDDKTNEQRTDVEAPMTDSLNNNDRAFSYESDLKNTIVEQVNVLFPEYEIFGSEMEGVEYNIDGKRIDILLEKKNVKELLVVELKADCANFGVFGQVSMYIGMLKEKFNNYEIHGLIIAKCIDKGLIAACKTNPNIKTKQYSMKLELI